MTFIQITQSCHLEIPQQLRDLTLSQIQGNQVGHMSHLGLSLYHCLREVILEIKTA